MQDIFRCIKESSLCDGTKDCSDDSDEDNCNGFTMDNVIKCQNTSQSIRDDWMCDGVEDCVDGTDEQNCTECKVDAFKCVDGSKCILKNKQCDAVVDCLGDQSDEENCMTCSSHAGPTWKCQNSTQCISETKLCDGIKDCLHESDERNCPICRTNEVKCKDGLKCVPGRCAIVSQSFLRASLIALLPVPFPKCTTWMLCGSTAPNLSLARICCWPRLKMRTATESVVDATSNRTKDILSQILWPMCSREVDFG